MIAYSSRDAVDVSFGAGGRMLKRVNAGAIVQPSANALLIAGPATGDESVESEPFIVSVDGALSGSVTVSLAWTGVANTPSALSVVLSPAAPTASVTTIPSATGTLTLTATAAGFASDSATYVVSVAAPTVDLNAWSYKIDPELPFESSWGNNPDGNPVKPRLLVEFESDPVLTTIFTVALDDTTSKYDGSAAQFGITLTPTEVQKGNVTPTFPMVARIADPAGGGFTVFKHRCSKDEHPYISPVTGAPEKWRNALTLTHAVTPYHPWGTVLWHVLAFYFDADMLSKSTADANQWDLMASLNTGASALNKVTGFNLQLIAGNGDPNAAWLKYQIESYANPNWLAGDYALNNAYTIKERVGPFVQPRVDEWIYIILQTRLGCGYVKSAAEPLPVYGSVGPFAGGTGTGTEYFVRMWHAFGSGSPIASIVPFYGYWGSPHDPLHSASEENALVNGVLTNTRDQKWGDVGLYGRLGRADTENTRIHRGCKVWEHQDGMDPIKVLTAFRGA